ncbi:hypothetical protein Bca101_018976 [Brassica carinata]
METLMIAAEHRDQYGSKSLVHGGFRSAPSKTFRQINCRTFHSGVGLLPRPKRTSSTPVTKGHPSPSVDNSRTRPTYSNSPPPTSVPIPKFSFRQKRTAFPVFDSAVEISEVSNSAPVSPTSSGDNPFHSTVSATMTLRRMLNLDPGDECRSGGFRGTWIRF